MLIRQSRVMVSNRLNLYYKRHLDSHIIGYRYNAVQYIMLMHTVLQRQQQNTNQTLNSQKTLYPVQAMGCLLCGGIWGKYIIMIPSHCIWIFLKHNSLRPKDASVSYIIIGWYNGFSLARRQAIIKPIVPSIYCQFDQWNKRVKLESKNHNFW